MVIAMIEHNGIEVYGIRGWPQYFVSVCGQVLCTKFNKKRILKQTPDTRGHLRVSLGDSGKRVFMPVHRLVAMVFLPNFNTGFNVYHKDGDTTNNHLENLTMINKQIRTALPDLADNVCS